MSKPAKVERQLLLTADRFTVLRATMPLPSGEPFTREIISHPGAVVIVPVLDDGRICLIRNYRIAVEQELLELPAGTLEPGQPRIENARRELTEETGYRCRSLAPLCEFLMSPGILDQRMYGFVATGLTAGDPAREFGEQITNCPVSISELDSLISSGQIVDSKTISTLLYYLRYAS